MPTTMKLIRASRLLSGVGVCAQNGSVLSWSALRFTNMSGDCNGVRNMSGGVQKVVTVENMNPNIIKLEYAVRGPLVIRAAEIEKELEKVCEAKIIFTVFWILHLF